MCFISLTPPDEFDAEVISKPKLDSSLFWFINGIFSILSNP